MDNEQNLTWDQEMENRIRANQAKDEERLAEELKAAQLREDIEANGVLRLTKREWFAGMALIGVGMQSNSHLMTNEQHAERAKGRADALLSELSAKEGKPKPVAPVDPMGKDFMRGVVSTERYANGMGLYSTLECGHINSGPISTAGDRQKPCLTCESNAKEGK